MCAVFGYKCFGERTPHLSELAYLAEVAEERGSDASGLAWETPDGVAVIKAPLAPSCYLSRNNLARLFGKRSGLGMPKLLIGHARAATHGHPNKLENDHPVYSKRTGTALVHNGVVRNADKLCKERSLPREAEVDTEALLRLWDARPEEKGVRARMADIGGAVEGGYTVALISARAPGELVLFRHDNPLVLAWDAKRAILFFASTQTMLGRIDRGVQLGPIPWRQSATVDVSNDHWLWMRSDGKVESGKFKARGDEQKTALYGGFGSYLGDSVWDGLCSSKPTPGHGSNCGCLDCQVRRAPTKSSSSDPQRSVTKDGKKTEAARAFPGKEYHLLTCGCRKCSKDGSGKEAEVHASFCCCVWCRAIEGTLA